MEVFLWFEEQADQGGIKVEWILAGQSAGAPMHGHKPLTALTVGKEGASR